MIDLATLPAPTADDAVRAAAARLADELDRAWPEVVLVPAPRPSHPGHRVRVAAARNPDWYRALCRARSSTAHPRRGKFDTAIKRQHVLTGLRALAEGRPGCYATLLRPLAQRFAQNS